MRLAALLVLLGVAMLAGCSTMTPARYSMSVETQQALKKFSGTKTRLMSLSSPTSFDANCRMMGPIQASDGMSIPQFVEKAFNDELKFSGIYADGGTALYGELSRVEFSSMVGLTDGYWHLGLNLKSSNGRSLYIDNRYNFKSGFDGITACNQTAQALGPAVQDLIQRTVSHPEFATLIR